MIIHAFEGLMTLDKDGVPIYGQAESHSVSEDGKVYTFTLRDGLKWSDGEALTASDFVYSWNRAIADETAADYEYMFEVVDGYDSEDKVLNVKALDDKTLEVNLISAVPYFLELCAFPTFSPVREDLIEANGDKWATQVETYIGNGAYKMTEWVQGSHILYTKKENYWDYDSLGMKNLKFVLMDDDSAILNAFTQDEILFADSMPYDEIDAWRDKNEFNLQGQLGTYYISFNVEKEHLDNPKVRQALTLAIDRDFIVTEIGKAGQDAAAAFVATGLTTQPRNSAKLAAITLILQKRPMNLTCKRLKNFWSKPVTRMAKVSRPLNTFTIPTRAINKSVKPCKTCGRRSV